MEEAEVLTHFNEALDNLRRVHTPEELAEATIEVNHWQRRLLEVSPSFSGEHQRRKDEAGKTVQSYGREVGALTKGLKMKNQFNVPDFTGLSPSEIREKVDVLRRENQQLTNPYLKKITENVTRGAVKGLVCPKCGRGHHGNYMKVKGKKKQPWCVYCNEALLKPGKQLDKWTKLHDFEVKEVK